MKCVPALLVAVGLLLLGLCIKAGIDNFSHRDRAVTVRGLAEREVQADQVIWPIVTKEMGNDLPQLYGRIQDTNGKVVAFLKANGITDAEISVNPPSVEDRVANLYDNSTRIDARYRVTNVVVVTSSQVQKVNELILKQTDLMKEGIAVVAGDYQYRTEYNFTSLNDIKPEMVAQATKAAREAADKFAADCGSRLGKIKTAQQGQFSVEDRDPYTPYIKNVRVVNSITYYLEN
ncbi:MAG: SIMPL domain-containing protein [Bacteroidales bacterium]|nr:SIMPL domain-containing protein [Bacteroidales bacterium]